MRPTCIITFAAIALITSTFDVAVASKRNSGAQGLIGNTIHGNDIVNGEEFWEYFRPDGTGTNLFTNGDTNTFTWRLNGPTMCLSYSDAMECSRFTMSGGGVVETPISGNGVGSSSRYEFLRGNARGL